MTRTEAQTTRARDAAPSIRWPAGLAPSECIVHTRNELSIAASPEAVWRVLIRAAEWSSWYANCRRLRFEAGGGPDLSAGTRWRWTTFGMRIASTVVEFEPAERLAWSARAPGSRGHHAWLLTPTATGCHVVTEETQKGWGIRLIRRPLRQGLLKQHQIWLEGLRERTCASE